MSNAGKWAEAQTASALNVMSNASTKFAWHRYPDSRSARGALAAQPADYLVAVDGKAYHLEVKESANPSRLSKSKIGQYGSLLRFTWAGVLAFVLIYRSTEKNWVCLDSSLLFAHEECPPSFRLDTLKTYATAEQALTELLK